MAFIQFIFFLATGITLAGDPGQLPTRLPFNLKEPVYQVELPDKLSEISGLTWYQPELLAAVEDEEGVIYLIQPATGSIQCELRFAGPGDFESIAYNNGCFYVLTSSGLLYTVDHLDPTVSTRAKTSLTWRNDVEGMCYDTVSDLLLIACKEQPSTRLAKDEKGKAVYALDINENRLIVPPAFTIKKKYLEPFLGEKPTFKPSAIAIDPITCNLYVLASVGKLLIVVSPDGTVLAVERLKPKQFRQPEGIAFSPEGHLFISNEAKGKNPTLYTFFRKSE
jgi:uncharacterized protein YjiK